MKHKKSEKVNLEKKRGLFLQIGLIVGFSIMLFAFEWATPDLSYKKIAEVVGVDIETEMVPVTRTKEIKLPPPKHYKKIMIIPDTEEPKETFVPMPVEVDPGEPVYRVINEKPEDIDCGEEPVIIYFAEIMPEFPGGIAGLKRYISKKVKYPVEAKESDIQGKVYVRFVVNSKGETEQVSIIRGVDPILDKEALRVVKSFPKWKPGVQGGEKVNVWFTVPINFKLQ